MMLNIAGLVADSIVDGPGVRYAVFVQGCPHHCDGCHNPQTWDFGVKDMMPVEKVFEKITADHMLDGVTFSGGEPFCQAKALSELAAMLRSWKKDINIMSYTGFEFEYLLSHSNDDNGYLSLLGQPDYLVDGPFILEKRSLELEFRGSSNQRFIDVRKSLDSDKIVLVPEDWNKIEIKLI